MEERSPGSAQRLRRGGRRPLLSEEDLCCQGEGELSCNGWVGVSEVVWTTTFDFVMKRFGEKFDNLPGGGQTCALLNQIFFFAVTLEPRAE